MPAGDVFCSLLMVAELQVLVEVRLSENLVM